jgi:hypothetical protein
MYIATEDESGYLKLFPPTGGWKPGKYRVEIHVGSKSTILASSAPCASLYRRLPKEYYSLIVRGPAAQILRR